MNTCCYIILIKTYFLSKKFNAITKIYLKYTAQNTFHDSLNYLTYRNYICLIPPDALQYCFAGVMIYTYTPINERTSAHLTLSAPQNYTNMPKMLPLRHNFIPNLTKHGTGSVSTPRLLPG